MREEHFEELLSDLATCLGNVPQAELLASHRLGLDGFDIGIEHYEEDKNALYVQFKFGIVSSGRSLRVFRLLLEANFLVYAQDQAQLAMESETGGVVLIVRVPIDSKVTGPWLAELLEHYVSHGRYWRENIFLVHDEMFQALADGSYVWIRG